MWINNQCIREWTFIRQRKGGEETGYQLQKALLRIGFTHIQHKIQIFKTHTGCNQMPEESCGAGVAQNQPFPAHMAAGVLTPHPHTACDPGHPEDGWWSQWVAAATARYLAHLHGNRPGCGCPRPL